MENWLSAVDPLAVIGLVLIVAGLLSFKIAKWVLEKIEKEDDKFILFLWKALRLGLLLMGTGGVAFGAWLIWPTVASFWSDLIGSIYV